MLVVIYLHSSFVCLDRSILHFFNLLNLADVRYKGNNHLRYSGNGNYPNLATAWGKYLASVPATHAVAIMQDSGPKLCDSSSQLSSIGAFRLYVRHSLVNEDV